MDLKKLFENVFIFAVSFGKANGADFFHISPLNINKYGPLKLHNQHDHCAVFTYCISIIHKINCAILHIYNNVLITTVISV